MSDIEIKDKDNKVEANHLIEVRRMTLEDVDAVSAIENNTFHSPWSKASIRQEIEDNHLAVYYVAVSKGKVVAYAGYWEVVDECHITNVAVDDHYRGQGIGHKLMQALIEHAIERDYKAMTLEVRVSNAVAIHLYEDHGFTSMGIRAGYYTDTKEDALIMWKELI